MRRKLGILVGALALVGLFGWLDHVTGTEVRSVLFYFLPIMLVAWTLRRRYVLVVAVASALAWGTAEFLLHDYHFTLASAWNEVSALSVFAVVGLSISSLRRERDELRRVNSRVQELLDNEARIARTDMLTGLPNSREFLERLQPEIARCLREKKPMCLLYLDLDNFKRVNDRHGHVEGDKVLRRVADCLRESLRAADVPARLGGDEFAALLWQATAEGATAVADRVLQAVRKIAPDYPSCNFGASVGIAWYEMPPQDATEVVRRADEAMYDAKRAGKGRTSVVRVSPNARSTA
ncbi:MAG: diguanylate cyclase [Planctomycetes bacterium]|nr:diguanylate cyclase [Planctomycetota bacterium]